MQLTVVGPGCARCKMLAQFTEQAATELGVAYELIKVTEIKQMMALGVMLTPALIVDGKVKVIGKVRWRISRNCSCEVNRNQERKIKP